MASPMAEAVGRSEGPLGFADIPSLARGTLVARAVRGSVDRALGRCGRPFGACGQVAEGER